jgi:hypothetical protein
MAFPPSRHTCCHVHSLFLLYLFGMSTDSVLLTLFVTANVLACESWVQLLTATASQIRKWLTPRRKVVFENLIIDQLVKCSSSDCILLNRTSQRYETDAQPRNRVKIYCTIMIRCTQRYSKWVFRQGFLTKDKHLFFPMSGRCAAPTGLLNDM